MSESPYKSISYNYPLLSYKTLNHLKLLIFKNFTGAHLGGVTERTGYKSSRKHAPRAVDIYLSASDCEEFFGNA